MNGLDLRPRVVLYTPSGAVVILVDPATLFGGSVVIPGLGSVPYDLDLVTQRMILHVPAYGDVPISLSGGGTDATVTLPGLGTILYEVTFGPPDIPFEQRATAPQALTGAFIQSALPVIALFVVGWWLVRRW